MNDDQRHTHTLRVIADAERLIKEVDQALEHGQRVLAQRGLDPQALKARVDAMTPFERERARQHVERGMKEVAESARDAAARAMFIVPGPSRPLRRVRNMI